MLLWTNYRTSVKTARLKTEIRHVYEASDVKLVLGIVMNLMQFIGLQSYDYKYK